MSEELDQKHSEQQLRGEEAERILNHPMVRDALESMKGQIDDAWLNSDPDEHLLRERHYLMRQLIRNFEYEFQRIIRTGEDAGKALMSTKDPNNPTRRI